MELDGVLLATTQSDQATFSGTAMLWGNAIITSQNLGFGYNGSYKIVGEAWNNQNGALAIMNETGTDINVTQFVVNFSRILSKNEIIIKSSPQVLANSITDNVQYDINVNSFGTLKYYAGYETFKFNSTSLPPNIINRTTFIGMMNSTGSPDNYTIFYGWGKGWFDTNDGKYHRLFYGYPVEAWMPNVTNTTLINGTIYDENGNPVSGINISFYQVTSYDPTLNSTNTDLLVPKTIPDTVTGSNGYYAVYLPTNTIWHMVMQGSEKIDFNLFTNQTSKGNGHNTDIFENNTDFNVEGHIYHSGRYENENFYTCNQYVEFTMFGMNKGDTNVTIRFVVENHTDDGQPTDNRMVCGDEISPINGFITNDSDILYCSYADNESEILFLPNDKVKYKKDFSFKVPCDWQDGKYDIHVYDNSKWGKMHKIGNFFIEDDGSTPEITPLGDLGVSSDNFSMYSNETLNVSYMAQDYDNNQTVLFKAASEYFHITVPPVYCNINVTLDQDVEVDTNGDGILNNDADYSNCGGVEQFMENVSYNKEPFFNSSLSDIENIYRIAKVHSGRLTAKDGSGRSTVTNINITVYLNEEEADVIGDPIYESFFNLIFFNHDWPYYFSTAGGVWVNVDRFDEGFQLVGDEYLTRLNTDKNPTYYWTINYNSSAADEPVNDAGIDVLATQASIISTFDTAIEYCGTNSPPFLKFIMPSTAQQYNNTLTDYLNTLKACGKIHV